MSNTEVIPVSEYRKMIGQRQTPVGPGTGAPAYLGEKPKKKQGHMEADLQVECVNWFRKAYPQLKDLLFHIPNGGHRNAIEAANLKRQGVVAGIPDLELAIPRIKEDKGNLFIEMKYGKNKESALQVEKRQQLQSVGNVCVVCYSFAEFQSIIHEWLKGTIYQPEIHLLKEALTEVFNLTWDELLTSRKMPRPQARYIFAHACYADYGMHESEIGKLLNIDRCTILFGLKKYEDDYQTNADFRALADKYNAIIKIKQNKILL